MAPSNGEATAVESLEPKLSAPPLEASLQLVQRDKFEDKVVGLAFLVSHHRAALEEGGEQLKASLSKSIGGDLLPRLLSSSPQLQRLAINTLRILLAGEGPSELQTAREHLQCALPIAAAFCHSGERGATSASGGDEKKQSLGGEELALALEILLQLWRLLALGSGQAEAESSPGPQEALQLLQAAGSLLNLLRPGQPFELALAQEDTAQLVLSLAHVLMDRGRGDSATLAAAIVEDLSLVEAFRHTDIHIQALALLANGIQAGRVAAPSPRLYQVVTAGVSTSSKTSATPPARAQALQLAATAWNRFGLSLGLQETRLLLPQRIRPLVVTAALELRLGLEGQAPSESTAAACMLLEAAVVNLGAESETFESGGALQEAADCLKELHRALEDIFCYLADLPGGELPKEVAMVARLLGAWQLEEPRRFQTEFQQSLPILCRLEPSDFKALLPCLQEMQEWHTTCALHAVLEVALWGLSGKEGALEAFQQAALMLSEVALDAAVYLPDAAIPTAPDSSTGCSQTPPPPLPFTAPGVRPLQLPRPLEAADACDPGVLRLASWSRRLWQEGQLLRGPSLWTLGVLCGALLTSVPQATLTLDPELAAAADWSFRAVVQCLVAGPEAKAFQWRLAMRTAGFVLDRHQGLRQALALAAAALDGALQPPDGALPGSDTEDEWAPADRAAHIAVKDYMALVRASIRPNEQAAAREHWLRLTASSCPAEAASVIDSKSTYLCSMD